MTGSNTIRDSVLLNDEEHIAWVRGNVSRGRAKAIAAAEIGCLFVEIISCRKVSMRPFTSFDRDDLGAMEWEGIECRPDHPAAEPWWRCEYEDSWTRRQRERAGIADA